MTIAFASLSDRPVTSDMRFNEAFLGRWLTSTRSEVITVSQIVIGRRFGEAFLGLQWKADDQVVSLLTPQAGRDEVSNG